jgi:YD repeat-containing protein
MTDSMRVIPLLATIAKSGDSNYDAANQLTTSGSGATLTTYTFDAAGNLSPEVTGATRTTVTWDDDNRLTRVEQT